jgi:predicted dinucleotide-binding enzyme
MEIGLYGLGRMGGNMVTRLVRGGHRVVAGNRSPGPVDEAKAGGAAGAYTIEEMARTSATPSDAPRSTRHSVSSSWTSECQVVCGGSITATA